MRQRLLLPLFLAFVCFALPGQGLAASWPQRPVTLVIPFSPKGESDAFYSLVRPRFQAATRQELVPQYQPGRGGADAWALMDTNLKDGSTLTGVNLPHLFLRSWQPDSGVDAGEMTVFALLSYTPCVLWVPDKSPFKSIEDFVDAARKAPGRVLVAGPATYSAAQLAAKSLDRLAGVSTTYIPYVGTVEAGKAALDGSAQAFWSHTVPWPESVGRFRALAVAAPERAASLPRVPTFAERGYDLTQGTYRGLAVPKETPPALVEAIHNTFARIMKAPDMQKQALEQGHSILDLPLETLPAFMNSLAEKYREQAESFGLFPSAIAIP